MTDRATREAQQLRALLAEHGVHPMPQPPEPRPMAALDDDLERRYADIIQHASSRRNRLAHRVGRNLDRRHGLALSGVAASALLVIGAVTATLFVQPPTPASADIPPMLNYEYDLTNDPNAQLGAPAGPVLLELAALAAKQPATAPAHPSLAQHALTTGSYELSTSDEQGRPTKQAMYPTSDESWLSPNGDLYQIRRVADYQLDMAGQLYAGKNPFADSTGTFCSHDTWSSDGSLDPDYVSKLSTDPAKLRAQLLPTAANRDPAIPEASYIVNEIIANIYPTYVVPPALQSAMWRVLAGEDSIRSLGTVTSRAGVTGTAVAQWSDTDRTLLYVLIFDPQTGALMGDEWINFDPTQLIDASIEPPNVISFSAYQQRNWQPVPARMLDAPPSGSDAYWDHTYTCE